MKRFLIGIMLLTCLAAIEGQAQTKKQLAHFPLFQQYYNPALTGLEGSTVKGLYRNQWTGFSDAPKIMIASVEVDPVDSYFWRNNNETGLRQDDLYFDRRRGKHTFGLTVLRDQFGPFSESQINLSYSATSRLTEELNLKWGTALTYNMHRLDGSKLHAGPDVDPNYYEYIGQSNRTSRGDFNIGVAITSQDFYIGYGMLDATEGKLVMSGDGEMLKDMVARQHVLQAGFRRSWTDELGIVLNGSMSYDKLMEESLEAQIKGVYQNKLWLGTGVRAKQGMLFSVGVQLEDLRIGYVHETSNGVSNSLGNGTNELVLTYNLFPVKTLRSTHRLTIW